VRGRRGTVQAAFHQHGDQGARGDGRRPSDRDRPTWSSIRQARIPRVRRGRQDAAGHVEDAEGVLRPDPGGKGQRIVLRFLASPVEIRGDGKVEIAS